MTENKFYKLKVNAEINLDIQANNHDMAINNAQKEVSIASAVITGVDE